MIELTNVAFNNLEFIETVQKIYRSFLPAKDAYKLFKLLKKLNEYLKEYDEIRLKLLKEVADSVDGSEWVFKSNDCRIRFEKEFNELLQIELKLDSDKIKYPEMLELSPYEMELMEPLFDYSNLDESD